MSDNWKITPDMVKWVKSMIGVELGPQWPYFNTEATSDTIRHFVDGIADPNPLYRDEAYARRSPYGRIVAPPSFLHSVLHNGAGMPNIGNWLPAANAMDTGSDWEWYKPLLLGDRFTCTQKITDVVEKQTRSLGPAYLIKTEAAFRNQRNELVAKAYGRVFHADSVENQPGPRGRPKYKYSKDEIRKIVLGYRNETVRGRTPRYWEDVQVGEELMPIVRGPLDTQDLVAWIVGGGVQWLRGHQHLAYPVKRPDYPHSMGKAVKYEIISTAEWVEGLEGQEDYTGVLGHIDSAGAEERGVGVPFDMSQQRMSIAMILLTHWQGDAGFLKSFHGELRALNQLGDTTWFKGRVSGKETKGEEHLVHIECWGENQLGENTTPCRATVMLPSKERGVGGGKQSPQA